MATVLPRVARPPAADEADARRHGYSVRLMLRGDSVIDWHRLSFADHAGVDRFLRLNEFDPESDDEMDRFEDIRADAVDYLARAFAMAIPDEVAADLPARDLFLVASSTGPHQKWACVVLKVMHIIHHINGRQALLKVSVSDEIIFREIELKVLQVVEQLRAAGAPLDRVRVEPQAARLPDHEAAREEVDARGEHLRQAAVPADRAAVPGHRADARDADAPADPVQLRRPRRVREPARRSARRARRDRHGVELGRSAAEIPFNEFSGPEYRIINFVADLPLRLERLLPRAISRPSSRTSCSC